jgi:hypothetical protein
MARKRDNRLVPIKYTSREFDSIKNDLVEYAKRYYPDSFQDFNEAGVGSLLLDTIAYIGDILSFYVDFQANESFLPTALEFDNIIKLGRQMGYKFRGNPNAYGTAAFFVVVPVAPSGIGPDTRYMPILRRGSQFRTVENVGFILNEDVNFADSNNQVIVAQVDDTTGTPTSFAVKAYGEVVSGELVRDIVNVPGYQKFLRVQLSSDRVTEVISVTDREGHTYYEVDNLSQNIIYKPVTNRNSDTDKVQALMRPFVVPRRFVVEQDQTNRTFLQFGFGSETELVTESVLDPRTVTLQRSGKNYVTDPSFDPTRLTETDKLGISPANTQLVVIYKTNTRNNVNVASGKLTKASRPLLDFTDITSLNADTVRSVRASVEVTNESPIIGDVSFPSSEELKRRIYDNFATQNRAVTKMDYISTIYSMPPQFGAIKRAMVVRDDDSFKRNLNIYVIAEGANGKLAQANTTLKRNVKTWLNKNRMINDTIDILNARILNVSIDFSIVADSETNKFDILASCVTKLQEKFAVLPDIGEAFYITDIYKVLNEVDGVVDTKNVSVKQKVGTRYADLGFNIKENMSADGRYFVIPEDVVIEVKFPLEDIKGVVL